MAMALIQPPPHFEPGTRPAHAWEEWRSSYELYEEACEYTTKSAGPRRALLLHVLGPAARKTYKGFAFPQPTAEQPCETSKDILDKFEELYKPYKNITHSSAIFNSIVQKQNQTIDELVSELKVVAIDCDYGEKQDRLIGDHIIFGIRDSALRERLLRKPSLSLDKIINFCKSAEISKEQAKILQPTVVTTDATINSLQQQRRRCHVSREYSKQRKGSAPKTTNRSVKPPANPRQQRRCSHCDTTHPPRSCPAYGSNCETCGTFGHFARVCNKQWQYKDRRVSVLDHQELDEDSDDSLYLSELTIDSLEQTLKWSHKLKVNNNDVIFKIDTGSDVNIIPIKAMSNWSRKPRIEPTTTKIKTYNGQILQVLGKCELKCTAAKSVACKFFVVAEDFLPILSADTSEELCLIQCATPTNIVAALETPNSLTEIINSFSDVFEGMGKLPGEYHIHLKDNVTPIITAPRRIPQALQTKVKSELERMTKEGIIVSVTEPNEWVHPLVVTMKKNGSIRLCLDPRQLNTATKREHYKIPTQQELFAQLGGCKFFSLFDAKDAFWQLQLDEYSSRLCTFATPWGRYRFLRLPFGLNCAPELFQRAMDELFVGQQNIHLYFDDILIAARTESEQCKLIHRLLSTARAKGLKLNKRKMKLNLAEITFLGHTLSAKGIAPDPQKINAIVSLPPPANTIELMRFMGMITYLTKFIPHFSQNTSLLRTLLKGTTPWVWDSNIQRQYDHIKSLLVSAPILGLFNPALPIVISTDASSFGIGSVLLQEQRPIAYASASLTPTQQRWAQIEKEMLAVVYACEKFHFYIYGTPIEIHTDHKPLLGLLGKPLEKITPRLQKLVLRLLRYDVTLRYIPGKFLTVADALSRAPTKQLITETFDVAKDVTVCTLGTASTPKLQELRDQTASDPVLQLVLTYIRKGWPRTKTIKNYEVRVFAKCAEELHVVDNLLCRGQRLVIPQVAHSSVLGSLNIPHHGMVATKSKARQSVYWPSINTDIEEMIRTCDICQKLQNNNPHEPLEDRTLTNRPWQSVALDFFHLNNNTYLLAVDYFSKYNEVQPMKSTTARCVITATKAMVARFGLPEELITDNGPPFDSMEFTNFLQHWDIVHNPTTPYNPRSNGQVERTVQTLKKSLQKASQEGNDLYTVLMDYRNTPANGLRSPAEIFLGRRIRTLIPTLPSNFKPNYDIKDTLSRLKTLQKQQHKHGDEHTRSLNPLKVDQQVWFAHNKGWEPGIIVQVGPQKRSYVIKAVNGSKVRRNRFHIKVRHTKQPTSTVDKSDTMVPESPENYYNTSAPSEQVLQQRIIPKVTIPDSVLVTSSGRRVIKPARYLN